jgi:hypothetical protein
MLPLLLSLLLTGPVSPACIRTTGDDRAARLLRASYIVTAADDFVVEVYRNGVPVPDSKRTMLEERFGATVERIDVEVRRGDWLVFNVVNNRMRWGGARYFGVAGCFAPTEFGFVSDWASRQWCVCDSPRDASKFIARRSYLAGRHVHVVANPWSDGDGLMRQYAGASWNGSPVWGEVRNTWIKVIVE